MIDYHSIPSIKETPPLAERPPPPPLAPRATAAATISNYELATLSINLQVHYFRRAIIYVSVSFGRSEQAALSLRTYYCQVKIHTVKV